MKNNYEEIWELAVPYLEKGTMKDFVLHTKNVVKSMELLIGGEGGDPHILIPAAILHDVGWSKIPQQMQTNSDLEKKREAQRLHLIYAEDIIKKILDQIGFGQDQISKIVDIVKAHKFCDPKEKDKQMLIDADNLSDTFKDQFESDVKAYKSTPKQVYEYRTGNTYYSKTANEIAKKNMKELKKELAD